jgi:hypothetical protein
MYTVPPKVFPGEFDWSMLQTSYGVSATAVAMDIDNPHRPTNTNRAVVFM